MKDIELPKPVAHAHSDGEFCWDQEPVRPTWWPISLFTEDQLRAAVEADRAQRVPDDDHEPMLYVASRASLPERPQMWQSLRSAGWPIISTWIDEAGEGETEDMGMLWFRIHQEIRRSVGVLLYAETGDFPLKGALIECGIALGMGKPVALVLPGVKLDGRAMKPVGSWIAHPLVTVYQTLDQAKAALLASTPAPAQQETAMQKLVELSEDLGLYDDPPIASGYGPKLMPQVSGYGPPVETLVSNTAQHQEPPQQERKPMTYREIADATSEWAHVRSDYTIGIIRAVESHHGIKE